MDDRVIYKPTSFLIICIFHDTVSCQTVATDVLEELSGKVHTVQKCCSEPKDGDKKTPLKCNCLPINTTSYSRRLKTSTKL